MSTLFRLTLALLCGGPLLGAGGTRSAPDGEHRRGGPPDEPVPRPLAAGPGARRTSDPRTVLLFVPGSRCSASIMEPLKVLLTAAHCLPRVRHTLPGRSHPLGTATLRLATGGTLSVECQANPSFPPSDTLARGDDIAVCRIPDAAETKVRASLGKRKGYCIGTALKPRDAVQFVGFGTPGDGPPVQTRCAGTLVGTNPLRRTLDVLPRENDPHPCVGFFGDSGGTFLSSTGDVVGVTSGAAPVAHPVEAWFTQFAPVASPGNTAFLRTALRESHATLCGFDGAARPESPESEVPPPERPPREDGGGGGGTGAVYFSAIVPGSPADRAGLRAGDRVLRVGTTPIDSLDAFHHALRDSDFTFEIERDGKTLRLALELGEGGALGFTVETRAAPERPEPPRSPERRKPREFL